MEQSFWEITTIISCTNLVASRLHEISRYNVLSDIETGPGEGESGTKLKTPRLDDINWPNSFTGLTAFLLLSKLSGWDLLSYNSRRTWLYNKGKSETRSSSWEKHLVVNTFDAQLFSHVITRVASTTSSWVVFLVGAKPLAEPMLEYH